MTNKFINFINEKNFQGTKEFHHKYISNYYCNEFENKRDEKLLFVEIGVRDGSDLCMFADWLHKSKIHGIDIQEIQKSCFRDYGVESGWGNYNIKFDDLENIKFILGDGYSDEIVNYFSDESIDYLIDDGTHFIYDQIICIEKYSPKIKKGGKIIIEDIGFATSADFTNTDECVERIKECAEKLNYNFKLFDLRSEKTTRFSVLVELQKR
tara:strand:- start:51 stop:680 length:630 start_codon:yes stop_codon:yes gene_type:complete